MKALIPIFGCCLLGSALALQAAEGSRAYFKLDAGVSLQEDMTVKNLQGVGVSGPGSMGSSTGGSTKLKFDTGARFDLAGGFNLLESLALELQLGLIYNSIREIPPALLSDPSFRTDRRDQNGPNDMNGPNNMNSPNNMNGPDDLNYWQIPILVNAIYTIPTGTSWLKPYVGAGAGGLASFLVRPGKSNEDITFAYQGLAGVAFAVSGNFDIGVTYKFMGSLDHDFTKGLETENSYNHSLMATFKVNF